MSLLRFRSLVFIFSTFGFYSIFVSFFYSVQQRVIFRPVPLEEEHVYEFDIPFEEFDIFHPNGEKVNSIYFPSEDSKALVLYFHGNSKNLQHWGKYIPDIVSRGYDVAAIDYRGYGKSTGVPSEANMYEDAQLIYSWAKEKQKDKEIVLWGRSLGTAIASHLSTQVSHETEKLILETPFYNMSELVSTRSLNLFKPVQIKYQFPNNSYIEENNVKTYIIQGTKDNIVPYRSAVKLKEILENDKHFFVIKGAGHKNLHKFNDYHNILDEIL